MSSEEPVFPPPLTEGEDATALLLQRALGEPIPGPGEQQSWERLQARRAARPSHVLVPALAALGLLVGGALWLKRPATEQVTLTPEPLKTAPSAPERAASRDTSAPVVPPSAAPPSHLKAPPSAKSSEGEADTGRCGKLAQGGHYDEAASCYGNIARGGSMSAELALYEKARIQAKALGKSQEALATLNEHARRFPSGLLGSEVALTRIELLSQLGRREQALAAIDRALSGPLGRERGGDLHLLRADLLASRGDCPAALEALVAAKSRGVHPSRTESVKRRCSLNGGK
jgi:tetratricopeptide (TPR) repeat protein